MNRRVYKEIKSLAKWLAFNHYRSLLEGKEAEDLTHEEAWKYTPDRQHVYIDAPSADPIRQQKDPEYVAPRMFVVSRYTKRWFIKQAKRAYKNV